MLDDDDLVTLRQILGEDLLEFLSGTDAALGQDGSPDTRFALHWIARNIDSLEREDPRLPIALVRTLTADGLPIAWVLREQAGGDVPRPFGTHRAERLLTEIARDVFPVLLSAPGLTLPTGQGTSVPAAGPEIALLQVVSTHPLTAEAKAALCEEFEDPGDRAFSSLSMTTRLLPPNAEDVLEAAARRLRHAPIADASAFMRLVESVLAERRSIAAGKSISLRALIGFASLALPAGSTLQLPDGFLRPATAGERRYAPFMMVADAVLETPTEAILLPAGAAHSEKAAAAQLRVHRLGQDVCLAAALTNTDDAPATCPAVAWITELVPTSMTSVSRPLHPSGPPVQTEALSSAQISSLETWLQRVADADLSHVAIAVDRLLRAIWELEATDSLIDAVIAWENLVGTRSETSFRVTAALSKLIEQDPSMRQAFRKNLDKIYNARSRVVHGDPPDADLHAHRQAAITTTLEAFRLLIRDRGDLLSRAKSSTRADMLILE
jgi:Apea-like HEPN